MHDASSLKIVGLHCQPPCHSAGFVRVGPVSGALDHERSTQSWFNCCKFAAWAVKVSELSNQPESFFVTAKSLSPDCVLQPRMARPMHFWFLSLFAVHTCETCCRCIASCFVSNEVVLLSFQAYFTCSPIPRTIPFLFHRLKTFLSSPALRPRFSQA